jgi:hypothetical protein
MSEDDELLIPLWSFIKAEEAAVATSRGAASTLWAWPSSLDTEWASLVALALGVATTAPGAGPPGRGLATEGGACAEFDLSFLSSGVPRGVALFAEVGGAGVPGADPRWASSMLSLRASRKDAIIYKDLSRERTLSIIIIFL